MTALDTALSSLRRHWPEYLIEAWALGTFMVSAGAVTILLEHPGSPVHAAIPDAAARRALIGLAMGLTAVALIYSPWGRRSGAHMNPAVTLSFLRLGKIAPWDALFFMVAQFAGGLAGVLLTATLFMDAFLAPPVSAVVTVPGAGGTAVAFAAELLISFGLMATVLWVSASTRFAGLTGLCAGTLVALYIAIEAPLSGMSINPARTLASALPAGVYDGLWLYFVAPPAGMLVAAELYRRTRHRRECCAKLDHSPQVRCIHCGYEPPIATAAQHAARSA